MKFNDFIVSEEKVRLDPKCWTGKRIGNPKTKVKGGVRVNNCVPAESVAESEKKGLYYNVNKRKAAGTSRDADSPKAPTAQAWKDAAKTAKKESVAEGVRDLEYDAQSLIMKLRRDIEEKRLQPTRQAVLAAARELAGDMSFAPELLVQQVLGQGVAEGSENDISWMSPQQQQEYKSAKSAAQSHPEIWKQYQHYSIQDLKKEFPNQPDQELKYLLNVIQHGLDSYDPNHLLGQGRTIRTILQWKEQGQQGVTEGEDGVDSLVTDTEAVMKKFKMDATQELITQALKIVLGEREYKDRPGYYYSFIRQIIARSKQQGLAEGSRNAYLKHNNLVDIEKPLAGLKSEFEKFLQTHDPKEKQKYQQGIKQRIKSEPMSGPKGVLPEQGVAEGFNGEYDDEAGMAQGNLYTIAQAAQGLLDTIDDRDNLPEWAQEKIAKVEGMLVSVWNYLQSQKAQGIDPEINEMYEAMDQLAEEMAAKKGISADLVWESFEALDDHMLYETAAWRRKEGKSKKGGLNAKGVASYRRENPGSKLQTAVTTKPSKLKPGSKAAKRRKSFCARMSGVKGPAKKPNGKPTRKTLALRKWNC